MILAVNGLQVEVRDCTESDVPVLLEFFHSLAAFEKLPISATEESIRQVLFGDSPPARALLALADSKPIGYVIYFFTFSTMLAKRGLWLEDLFITPAYRGRGVGKALMAYVAEIAAKNDCGRFEWIVLDWNESAVRFYEGLGATILKEWRICRLDEGQLKRVAGRSPLPNVG